MNARLPIYELAKISGYSTKTVVEKIRAFVKSGLIQSFTIGLNVNAIDHFTFKIFIYFNDVSKNSYSSVFNFCKELIQVRYITETIGSWELELGLETPEPRDLQMIIKTLKNRFPHEIKQIDSVTILDEVKLEFFP
jgi:DNA-binding Lrp family transcriptional regulator